MPPTAATEIHDQTNLLPRRQLIPVFAAVAFGVLVAFIDQNSIGVALPTIGRELDCASTIEWAGTSSLIANTAFQVLYGRLSDVLGRKVIMLVMLGLLAIGDLLCGFAKTGNQLYAFRGISGMATGGISTLSMIIVSDVVALERRGKYQGMIGSVMGFGNTIGPFVAAGFTKHGSWRHTFYLISPLSIVAGVVLFFILPPQDMPKENLRAMAAKVDWIGIFLSSGGIILILIPVSGIGSRFQADSLLVISMLTLGALFLAAFVFNEWKLAKLPMIPLRLFKSGPLSAMLLQNLLLGITWYSELYFIPIYFQSARQLSITTSAALLVPLVVSQSIASALSGQYISWKNRYGEVIWLGFSLWTLTAGLHLLFDQTTHLAKIAVILAFEGFAVGCVFQPLVVAAQAHSSKADRAVVISARNFIRSLGGAIGLAISSAIYSNSLDTHLPSALPASIANTIRESTFAAPKLSTIDATSRYHILNAYTSASRSVFIMWVAMMGGCVLLMVFVKDNGLQRKEDQDKSCLEKGEEDDVPEKSDPVVEAMHDVRS